MIAVLCTPERMSRADYEAILAEVGARVGPNVPGWRHHCCFGEEDSLRVLELWDSEESLTEFQKTLHPVLKAQGVTNRSEEIVPVLATFSLNYTEKFRAAHDLFNANDLDAAAKCVAENFKHNDYGKGMAGASRADFRGWLDGHRAMSSDMTLVDRTYMASGNWVIARFRAVGHQDGPLGPFPPSGKPYALDACEVWRFNEAGLAVEAFDYSDSAGLMAQLGHISLG